MKTLVTIGALCLPAALHAAAFVDGIETISQSYHVTASWSESIAGGPDPIYPPTIITGGYDQSSFDGSPVSASTATPPPFDMHANASVGAFSLYDHAWASPYTFFFGPDEYVGAIHTTAQGVWDFRTQGSVLNVGLSIQALYGYFDSDPGFYSTLDVKLTDMTAASTLLDIANPMDRLPILNTGQHGGSSQSDYTFAADPGHVYEFSVSAYSDMFDGDAQTFDVSGSITAVPEPSFFLEGALILVPFAFVGWRRYGRALPLL